MAEETTTHFAEIIESSIEGFTAQTWEWNVLPTFGSLVQVETEAFTIFGCVTDIKTGSDDPLRQPFTYKKTESELAREQPQIFAFLKTTFQVQITGYQEKNIPEKFFYLLPYQPCKIHAFVKEADVTTYSSFFRKVDFLNLLFAFQHKINNLDELLLALIRTIKLHTALNDDFLSEFCSLYSLLSNNDYKRLKLFLQRLESHL